MQEEISFEHVVDSKEHGVFQGPTLRYTVRSFWKNSFTFGWPSRFYKTWLHSLFYENAEVMTPGTPEYWEARKLRAP